MFCNSCGAEIAGDAKFCTKCGKAIGSTSAGSSPSSAQSAPHRGAGMRKGIVIGAVALAMLFLGAWIYASPYLALRGLKGSIEEKNPQAMYDYVDFPVFKESLKREMLKDLKEEKDNPFAEFGVKMVEGLVEMFVNPETMIKVFSKDESDKKPSSDDSSMGEIAPKLDLSEDKLKMGYTGLNSFELAMPNEDGGEWAFILHRKGLGWKIDDVRITSGAKSSSSTGGAAAEAQAASGAAAVTAAAAASDATATAKSAADPADQASVAAAAVKGGVDAGLPEMMKIYNSPELAPQAQGCQGDIYCNAFIALSNQWKAIPDSYRYNGEYDIKAYAKSGVSYDDQGRNVGLEKGFYFRTERSQMLIDGVGNYTETEKHTPWNYEGGLAVLLYIEDKNGWAKD